MAKVIRATMSEWHQVQRKYALEIDVDCIVDLYNGEITRLEAQEKFDKLASGDLLIEDIEEDVDEICWEYQDEDDWWTMRKGGFDVTYDQALWDTDDKT